MWAEIAGHHSVTIIVIVGKDVEQVVAASVAQLDQRYLSDDIG
jgi:hypothetical protein